MKKETLKKANEIDRKIRDYQYALDSFEWVPEGSTETISLNPKIIIEYDGDGREESKLPDVIDSELIPILREYIRSKINELEANFRLL